MASGAGHQSSQPAHACSPSRIAAPGAEASTNSTPAFTDMRTDGVPRPSLSRQPSVLRDSSSLDAVAGETSWLGQSTIGPQVLVCSQPTLRRTSPAGTCSCPGLTGQRVLRWGQGQAGAAGRTSRGWAQRAPARARPRARRATLIPDHECRGRRGKRSAVRPSALRGESPSGGGVGPIVTQWTARGGAAAACRMLLEAHNGTGPQSVGTPHCRGMDVG